MSMKRGLAIAVALGALWVAAAPAEATFHLMKIREVGQGGAGVADYVVLQMYSPGQSFVAGKQIRTYDSLGAVQDTFTFPADVSQGDNQRTIYVARNDGTPLGTPDFVSPDLVLPSDGAVCFGASMVPGGAVDCVSYGSFSGVVGGDPSAMGTPAPAPAPGQALHRSIAAGCATFLEPGDDTDNRVADFSLGPPDPRNNATAPTEVACATPDQTAPQTSIDKGPKARSTKTTAKFRFSANERGAKFECKLDKGAAKPCKSPRKYKHLEPGRHKFTVAATDAAGNTDRTPAKLRFKIVAKD